MWPKVLETCNEKAWRNADDDGKKLFMTVLKGCRWYMLRV